VLHFGQCDPSTRLVTLLPSPNSAAPPVARWARPPAPQNGASQFPALRSSMTNAPEDAALVVLSVHSLPADDSWIVDQILTSIIDGCHPCVQSRAPRTGDLSADRTGSCLLLQEFARNAEDAFNANCRFSILKVCLPVGSNGCVALT